MRLLFSTAFKRQLRDLAKRYRHIRSDLQPVLDQLLMIYYLQTERERLLVTIYSKSDQADVAAAELHRIIQTEDADPGA